MTFVLGTRRTPAGHHEGVIRDGKAVIVACGHKHNNRDQSTQTNGRSARDCIALLVKAAHITEVATDLRRDMRSWPAHYARRNFATRAQLARLTEQAEADVETFDRQIRLIAQVINGQPVYHYADQRQRVYTGQAAA